MIQKPSTAPRQALPISFGRECKRKLDWIGFQMFRGITRGLTYGLLFAFALLGVKMDFRW